jgi:hypothetical protein
MLKSQESKQGRKAETQYGGRAADAKSFLTALARQYIMDRMIQPILLMDSRIHVRDVLFMNWPSLLVNSPIHE